MVNILIDTHHVIYNVSLSDGFLDKESVDLVVTSPPYPMVAMWDKCFKGQNSLIQKYLDIEEYNIAWMEMHRVLNNIWREIVYCVKPGGFVCINIGDATRRMGNIFQLYPNHSVIIDYFIQNNFQVLPCIIWRKPTNSPTKFMGSGMYPNGAYVTLEHEYILVFRKNGIRTYTDEEKEMRKKSAYFYNERNIWFSDMWNVLGVSQKGVAGSRERSGAYPLEIPYRLINMYSMQGDVVVDPFAGLGTTMLAGILSGRHSLNFEIDSELCNYMCSRVLTYTNWDGYNNDRLRVQKEDVESAKNKGKKMYFNEKMCIEVRTKQECGIVLPFVLETFKKQESNAKIEVISRYR